MQRGGINVPDNNDISTSTFSDCSTVNPPLGAQSTDQHPPVTSQYDSLITTTSFNSSSIVGGVMLGDILDQIAERFNLLELLTSNNRDDLLLLCSSIDQLRATSNSQCSS